jgi:hypothetical protein
MQVHNQSILRQKILKDLVQLELLLSRLDHLYHLIQHND